MINTKLSEIERKTLLNELLGVSTCENGVVYDEDGDEFYGCSDNDKYDFGTLKGIIEYVKDESFQSGVRHSQREIKKVLNL
ncbi:hypothetical protein [uncultured Tenacibaculum sp.]|uniref:hypothetical protein n=1 Tax=uncultured Tenacibaculum sp. TaxID=174713 RepID=UPI002626ECF3|nr:hypothetical protein [uncultured Tenacibaculum sp.]